MTSFHTPFSLMFFVACFALCLLSRLMDAWYYLKNIRPSSVMGMHFFSPAHMMPLVECVRGADTSPLTIAVVMGATKRLKKVWVLHGLSALGLSLKDSLVSFANCANQQLPTSPEYAMVFFWGGRAKNENRFSLSDVFSLEERNKNIYS